MEDIFVRVGEFKDHQFSIQDQLKGRVVGSPRLFYGGCHNEQLKPVHALAAVELEGTQSKLLLLHLLFLLVTMLFFYVFYNNKC
jgi:hypothetical protein